MSTINQLPKDLLVKILDYLDSSADLAQCRLVCQHWDLVAEPLMFGKDITLTSQKGSLSFYGHLYRKPHYGCLVKRLTCEVPATQPGTLEALLKLAFTPTMEQMHAQVVQDQFDKLTAIPHPRWHNTAYYNVLMKLNNTLQRIVIKLDGSGNHNMLHFFDNLGTFKRLTSIEIHGLLDSFVMMETILDGCDTLQDVAVNLLFTENIRTKHDMTTWMTGNIKIAHKSIKSLKITDSCRADLLEFFIHKYPSLESIEIKGDDTMASIKENMQRSFTVIKQIPSRKIKLIVDQGDLSHALKQLLSLNLPFTLKEEDEDQFCIEINSP